MLEEHPLKTVVFRPKAEHIKIHEKPKFDGLPAHPFGLGIIGGSGHGKTNLLLNILLRWFNDFFHRIFICSASWDTDDAYTILHGKIPEEQVCTDITLVDEFVEDVYQQQADPENNKSRRCLLVFDDFGVQTKKIKSLNSLARSRHSNMSIILISQKLIGWVVPSARTNLGYLALFPVANAYERKAIATEYAKVLTPAEFLELYDQVCQKRGDYLWLNMKADDQDYYKANMYQNISVTRTK